MMKIEPQTVAMSALPLAGRLQENPEFSGLPSLYYCGHLILLRQPLTAFFCSRQAKAAEVLKAYNQATELRQSRPAIIGGFHSPVERDCLKIFLKGPTALIICPARGLSPLLLRGYPDELQPLMAEALKASRLLFLSPFGPEVKRASQPTAQSRNRFVLALAHEIIVPYASPGGLTESLSDIYSSNNLYKEEMGWVKL